MRAHLLPGQRLHPTRSIVHHSALDLFRPGFFVTGRGTILQTLEEETGKFGTIVWW